VADTIREQIIAAYMTRLEDWTTANGFNVGCGGSVFRAVQDVDPDTLPACVLHPRSEEATQRYGINHCEMVLRIEAMAEVGTTNPSVIQEQMLGDALTIMQKPPYLTLTFAAAGYISAVAGDVGKAVIGGATGDTGTLLSYDNSTRQWTIQPDTASDEFDNGAEAVTITDSTGAGTLTQVGIETHVTSLIEGIAYTSGGPASVPAGEDTITAVFAEFTIKYNTLAGNPYSQ
jgi:hypothetical protein